MARHNPPHPGAMLVTQIEVKQIPNRCQCSWSVHGGKNGEPVFWRLKIPYALCPESDHRNAERTWNSKREW